MSISLLNKRRATIESITNLEDVAITKELVKWMILRMVNM